MSPKLIKENKIKKKSKNRIPGFSDLFTLSLLGPNKEILIFYRESLERRDSPMWRMIMVRRYRHTHFVRLKHDEVTLEVLEI